MIATDFTRYDCQLGKRRVSYAKLQRDYRCADCGGIVIERWGEKSDDYPENWRAVCFDCLGNNFIHVHQVERQRSEAIEVMAGLPQEMRDILQPPGERLPDLPTDERGIFSLSPIVVEL